MIAVVQRDKTGITCREEIPKKEKTVPVPNAIEVVTLFSDDITQEKAFYESVFTPEVI